MSTHAIVAAKQEDGNYGYNFVTFDGYFEGVGLDLVKHANNQEAANILIMHDDWIDSVTDGMIDTSDATLFPTRVTDSIDSLIKIGVDTNIGYIYWFDGTEWYGRETGQCSFKLNCLLTKYENPQEFADQFISFEKGKLKIDIDTLRSAVINEINDFDLNDTKEQKNQTVKFFTNLVDFFETFIKK